MSAGAAAYANAGRLYSDARLLFRAGRYPSAASLAVVGCEEAGKSLILVFAGLQRIPIESLPVVLKSLRKDHLKKQAFSMVGVLLGEAQHTVLDEVMPDIDQIVADLEQRQAEMDASTMVTAFEPLGKRIHVTLDRGFDTRAINDLFDRVATGEWQRIRNQGLYVDFWNTISLPTVITRDHALDRIATLRSVLRGSKPFVAATSLPEGLLHEMAQALASLAPHDAPASEQAPKSGV